VRTPLLATTRDVASGFPHLPPGHAPGPQSVRNRIGFPLLFGFVGTVGAAMLAAGMWVAAGGRGDRFDRGSELLGGLVLIAGGLLCASVAYWQIRKVRPVSLRRRLGRTRITADDESRRGMTVTARVDANTTDRELEIGLVCVEAFDVVSHARTQAGSINIRQTSYATTWETWQHLGPDTRTYRFLIPADGPYSYEGDCLSYAWRVSVREVRRLRVDPRLDRPIWVHP
jgi:hypothetical protein